MRHPQRCRPALRTRSRPEWQPRHRPATPWPTHRNPPITAFNRLAPHWVATDKGGASRGSAIVPTNRTDAQAVETLREGSRLAARSGYTSEALQSLISALPAGTPTPVWARSLLPSQTLGPALAKEIKKIERKALGR